MVGVVVDFVFGVVFGFVFESTAFRPGFFFVFGFVFGLVFDLGADRWGHANHHLPPAASRTAPHPRQSLRRLSWRARGVALMLSIGRLGPSGAAYYTEAVARGAEDYYLGAGEAPGVWVGSGIDALGLSGVVDDVDFVAVLAGQHPGSGVQLVAAGEGRLPGLDLTFSAPKSVSLLWATTVSDRTRQLVLDAHRAAVADAVAYLEADAVWARRGHNGVERVRVEGLVAAAFGHRTSRAGDPQLHTHVVAANVVRDAHGRWSALDSRAVFRHARTAGFVYPARLRHALTEELGEGRLAVRSGQADLAGFPPDACQPPIPSREGCE